MRRVLAAAFLIATCACLAGCPRPDDAQRKRIERLENQVAALTEAAGQANDPAAAGAPPELGTQMLELQVRHARLWQAGAARNWMLAQFQLAELRESEAGIVQANGEHAALQPQRLADVMPAMLDPSLAAMQSAVDAHDGPAFDAAYDQLSAACTACHAAAGHGFLVIQRPRTPVLDNLRAEPIPDAAP